MLDFDASLVRDGLFLGGISVSSSKAARSTLTLAVGAGDSVTAGDPIAIIEAMKMEAAITVPAGGTVSRTAIDRIAPVEGGDLLLVVDVGNAAKCEQPPDRSAEIVGVGC